MVADCKYQDDGSGVRWVGTPEEKTEYDAWYARQEIFYRLAAIDAKSARPLRAILAAQAAGQEPSQDDISILSNLESEAATLRGQL